MSGKRMVEFVAFRSGINVDWSEIDNMLQDRSNDLADIIGFVSLTYNTSWEIARKWVYSRMDKLDAEDKNGNIMGS